MMEKNTIFKTCPVCQRQWENIEAFLSDPEIQIVGYQVHFEELEAGLFFFHHSCNNTLACEAKVFKSLQEGPIFTERLTGTDQCPGHCLYKNDLSPCPAACECNWVRDVLQKIKAWPKSPLSAQKE